MKKLDLTSEKMVGKAFESFIFIEDLSTTYKVYCKYQSDKSKTFKHGFRTCTLEGTLEFFRGIYVAHMDLIIRDKINSMHRFSVLEERNRKDLLIDEKDVFNSNEFQSVSSLLDITDLDDYFIIVERKKIGKKITVQKNRQVYENKIELNGTHVYQFSNESEFKRGYNTFMKLLEKEYKI